MRVEADRIEAGLNEGAGRFALARLWALCRAALRCERSGLEPPDAFTALLAGAGGRNGDRLRREDPGPSRHTPLEALRAQAFLMACDLRIEGADANRGRRRDRHDRAHDVSQRNGAVLERGRSPPRGASATILITPPHSVHGGGLAPALWVGPDAGGSSFAGAVGSTLFVKSERQSASFFVRWPLARNPKWRMRWKPSGKT